MAWISWLRRSGTKHVEPPQEEQAPLHETSAAEEELRDRLAEDPNDQQTFDALAKVVLARTEAGERPDPLTSDVDLSAEERHAVWALAEELAGQPKAWLPLIVLARLSLESDHEGAMRRLNAACERETTGLALTHSLAMLRDAGALNDAVSFGVARWELASRTVAAGQEVVLAALEAGRVHEARRLFDTLMTTSGSPRLADVEELLEVAERDDAAEREAAAAENPNAGA